MTPWPKGLKSKNRGRGQAKPGSHFTFSICEECRTEDLVMDDAVFIYRNRSKERFYDASTGEMRGGPDKVIAYVNGFLCALDRETKIVIPVSRWKLAEIGLVCVLAALRGKGAATRSVEPVPLATTPPQPEALPGPPPEATESSEARWERLMQEMRDLSRQ